MEAGDFGQRVLEQSSLLKPYALRLTRDADRALDLVQDSLLKALLNRDKFQHGTDLKAWLRTLTKHTFINQYRHRRLSRALEGDMAANRHSAARARSADDPLSECHGNELRGRIDRLPAGLREALVLYGEGFKYEEIAAQLTLPLGTVKSRIHHARQQLRPVWRAGT